MLQESSSEQSVAEQGIGEGSEMVSSVDTTLDEIRKLRIID